MGENTVKRKFAPILVCLALLFTMVGCTDKNEENVLRIGVFEPQSGENGAGGKQEILGIQFANHLTPTVNIGGKTFRIELVYADNESSIEKAPHAAQSLVSAGCSVVLGSYGSGVSIAASGTFGKAGIPVIGATCTNPQVTQGNSHYFRICFLDPFQGTVLANFARDQLSAEKAYCLAKQGDSYSVGLCNYFIEAFGKENCEYETFPEDADLEAYVLKAKSSGADVFFAPISTEAASIIIDHAADQGLAIPLLSSDTWDSNVVLNAAADKAVDVYITTYYQEGGNPQFDDGFKKWINSDAQLLLNNGGDDKIAAVSVMGYDAYYVALQALKEADSTEPTAVMAVLGRVTYDGVSGPIAFDGVNGDALRGVAYIKRLDPDAAEWVFVAQQGV